MRKDRTIMKCIKSALLACLLAGASHSAMAEILPLEQAIKTAITNAPRLEAQRAARGELAGDALQAGLRPNPELSLEMTEFGGQDDRRGVKGAEISASLSQPLDIYGKRAARQKVAEDALPVALQEEQAQKLDIAENVAAHWFRLLAAGKKVEVAAHQEELATKTLRAVQKRVDAARDPVFQKTKAEVALANARLATAAARTEEQSARQALFLTLGVPDAGQSLPSNEYEMVMPPLPLETLKANVQQTPDYKRLEKTRQQGMAVLAYERLAARPDPSLSLGITEYRETNDQAFMIGVSLPLTVFDRNQGNIAKAGESLRRMNAEGRQVLQDLTSELHTSWQAMNTAYQQARSLKQELLPQAQKAYAQSRDGYERGNFSYLEVLDAQRTLAETRLQ